MRMRFIVSSERSSETLKVPGFRSPDKEGGGDGFVVHEDDWVILGFAHHEQLGLAFDLLLKSEPDETALSKRNVPIDEVWTS